MAGNAYKFYLDGNEVTTPIGWDEGSITIERDNTIKGLVVKYTNKLTFIEDGYDYIYKVFQFQGWCKQIDVLITYDEFGNGIFTDFFEGKIIVVDSEFDLDRQQVHTSIVDNIWGAKIAAKKDIQVTLGAGVSLGNTQYVTTLHTIEIFDQNCLYHAGCEGVKVFDAFDAIVKFMTDVQVQFKSDTFDAGGQYEKYLVATGQELRTRDNTTTPTISFSQLFGCLANIFNLSFGVEMDGTQPIIRIETTDTFYSTTPSITLEKVSNVKLGFQKDYLYNSIQVGDVNEEITTFTGAAGLTGIWINNHRIENFGLSHPCGIGSELTLTTGEGATGQNVNPFSYGHNTIISCIADGNPNNGNEKFDNFTFLINYDQYDQAVISSPYGITHQCIYNGSLFNGEILSRWANYLPGDVVKNTSNVDNTCEIGRAHV